ncbi:universal stress protein A [Pandoraea communis]|uniref:Universal stress protein A n=1 Tax=Pandoraea communis TaxID=2508297 RepID=A0A5E4UT55_9BURK|nr:universal stress protein [Pandoraea communis]VVE02095.1 universal stress protein A [Pandoraea communis]
MSFKSVLVLVDDSARCESHIELAAALADTNGGHLIGIHLYVHVPIDPLDSPYVELDDRQTAGERMQHRSPNRQGEAKLRFMEIAQRYSLSADWLAPTGIANEALPKYARYADLAVMGQLDPGLPETYALTHLVERVVLGSGRPTLVLPGAAIFPKRFAHVLLAWNGSREAARAVADALPLVQAAGHVTVLSISAGRQDDLPGVDIADYLRRHCTDVAFARRSGGGTSTIGETILESAKEIGADLLVMGSYGHSRLQELVLGGVTRTVLETLDLPVLMSH